MKSFKDFIVENERPYVGTDNPNSDEPEAHYIKDAARLHPTVHLEPHEQKSLEVYSGTHDYKEDQLKDRISNHKVINGYHRHGDHSELKDKIEEHTKNLDSLIAKHTTEHPLKVWRGLTGMIRNDSVTSHLSNMNPGDIFHDKGYVSTSTSPKAAKNFSRIYGKDGNKDTLTYHLAHIKVPKGSHTVNLNHHENAILSEHEVLLPRNSKFRYEGSMVHPPVRDEYSGLDAKTLVHHLTYLGPHND